MNNNIFKNQSHNKMNSETELPKLASNLKGIKLFEYF